MTRNILALPVDARPVTCDQVRLLADIAGWRLSLPPRELLGQMREPGDRNRLAAWLLKHAEDADGLVLSIDTLVYGGLVPSRLSDEREDTLAARLDVLAELKRLRPALPINAFVATMRIPNNNHCDEERLYWADYGRMIWRWSHHLDRHAVLGDPADLGAAQELQREIPAEVLDDYRINRARNNAITERVLDLVAEGVIDRLVLPQDDTAEFGINVAERRALVKRVGRLGIAERVVVLPGADEVIWTQVARLIVESEGTVPRFAIDWSRPDTGPAMIARYEDRPLEQTIAAHIAATGGVVTEPAADVAALHVHTIGAEQGDWAQDRWPAASTPAAAIAWLDRLASRTADGNASLIDLAHANGGDPEMIALLRQRASLARLSAYGGWNTAGNSIGSVIAASALPTRNWKARRHLLATRFVDDLVYQADCRQAIRAADINVATPEGTEAAVALFRPRADAWLAENGFEDLAIDEVWFPWARTFEIGFTLTSSRNSK